MKKEAACGLPFLLAAQVWLSHGGVSCASAQYKNDKLDMTIT
jgi:hypothetical protein